MTPVSLAAAPSCPATRAALPLGRCAPEAWPHSARPPPVTGHTLQASWRADRSLVWLLAVGLSALLAACGGGGGGGGDAEPVPVTTAAQAVGPTGGSLTITAASLRLEAGALAAEAPLTLESLPPDTAAGDQLRLRLGPAGRRLANPATLTVDLPGAVAGTQAFWLVGGDAVLAPATRSGDRFTLRLNTLGYLADGSRLPLAGAQGKRALAINSSQRALADGDPLGQADGNLVMRVLNCEGKAQILSKRLARLGAGDAIDEATLLSEALGDVISNCGELQRQLVQKAACDALRAAADNASLTLPTTLTELSALSVRLFGAAAIAQIASATCNPEPDVAALVEQRVQTFLAILGSQLRRGDFATEAGARELGTLFALQGECEALGFDAPCAALRDTIFPNLLDAMRAVAFDECGARGTSLPVTQFLDLGTVAGREGPFLGLARFRSSEVEADLMQCLAPTLAVRVFTTVAGVPQALPERDLSLRPMRAFNDYQTTGQVRAPRDGNLVLEGPVAVARCPDGSALGADLVVRIAANQREVARRPHNGTRFTLDTRPIDLAVADLLSAAALDPATASAVKLIVRQEGGACPSSIVRDGLLLAQPVVLFQLDVGLAQGDTWAGSVSVEATVVATLRGTRVAERSVVGTDLAAESTSESVDLAFSQAYTVAVRPGTTLLPGVRVALDDTPAATTPVAGTASVSSQFNFLFNNCIQTRSDTATLTGTLSSAGSSGNAIMLTTDGQLRIDTLRQPGNYTATSRGTLSGTANGGCTTRSFSQAFGPTSVSATFLEPASRTVTAPAAATALRLEGSNTVDSSLFFSSSQCNDFLRAHLSPMAARLLLAERTVQCTQRTRVTWLLQRE